MAIQPLLITQTDSFCSLDFPVQVSLMHDDYTAISGHSIPMWGYPRGMVDQLVFLRLFPPSSAEVQHVVCSPALTLPPHTGEEPVAQVGLSDL